MMGSAAWPLTVAAAYLYFVLSYGPKLMKTKEAYSFKTFIYCYNVYQVIANSLMFYTVLTSGWTTTYTLGCQYVDRSDSPEAMRMASAMWYWFLLKQTELIETVLFVLRKKKRQISFLHVYHHVSTFFIAWIACNFAPGGLTTFSVMPNSAVHVMLYSYYLLSAIDNEALRKRLNTFKKYLTTIQIIQLAVIVAHSSQALLPSCNAAPKTLAYSYVPNVLLVIYLFYNFYRVNYRAAAKRTAAAAVTPVTAAAARDLSFTTPTSERRAKEE
ncbi:hypothetical protein ONE63_005223 [Megalurothrips usitatus]|uniref:Elongation of very long chain fatty acids protein n=1 Tax=Megalurothrips usitatus TaxID=439358 RepID=A0AAV7XUP5_9NEOP|nr:hypothetical protein ONE63_005223 [Megalurothrips usitatus]